MPNQFSDELYGNLYRYVEWAYPNQYRLVIQGGKLTHADNPRDDWKNAARHCFVQAVMMEKLCELMNLSPKNSRRLIQTAACHDWDKRLEKVPGNFTEEERTATKRMFAEMQVDERLLEATKPGFLLRMDNHFDEIEPAELIAFYLDDIVDQMAMLFEERIAGAMMRNPDHPWDEEKRKVRIAEEMVLYLTSMESPQALVNLLNADIERRFS